MKQEFHITRLNEQRDWNDIEEMERRKKSDTNILEEATHKIQVEGVEVGATDKDKVQIVGVTRPEEEETAEGNLNLEFPTTPEETKKNGRNREARKNIH